MSSRYHRLANLSSVIGHRALRFHRGKKGARIVRLFVRSFDRYDVTKGVQLL